MKLFDDPVEDLTYKSGAGAPKIYTVSEFNRIVKNLLENAYAELWVEGEISNFRGLASSGHCYFSLKDENAQVDVVAFRPVVSSLRFKMEEGLKVLICGQATLYPQRGRFQIVAARIEPKGAGALQLAFEQLKKKLKSEGLFDPSRKKPIPALPQKIGIVTSPTGAAIRDILTVINRRFANIEILIFPAKVQGEGSKEEISEGIGYLNQYHSDLDVLLVGRGGGSIEDLWSFNEEIVARAIASSKIPVISCVGHEVDFTIADFVADLRAPTPSAAAELVVKNKAELQSTLENYIARLYQKLGSAINFFTERLKGIVRTPVFLKPQEFFEVREQMLDEFLESLNRTVEGRMETVRAKILLLGSKIVLLSPKALLDEKGKFLQQQIEKLSLTLMQHLRKLTDSMGSVTGRLEALSPLAVLSRGYSIAWTLPENKLLKSVSQVKMNDSIRVKLHRGELEAKVLDTKIETR